ncbi:hypothetical protein LX32DRAFT_696719 [Colletotrichum zoysiae]|uniref:TauD/TfdA-like domain-containing protein n=1 Tax=Colletotrichum zoysiae TaxID=1216348 RepID=A0AAD9H9R0_9PEZI|nr:hypothetical protein LX32DRAFT_696719 [Colletotrichum zoysiae]
MLATSSLNLEVKPRPSTFAAECFAFVKQFSPLKDQSIRVHYEHPYRLPFTKLTDSRTVEYGDVIMSRNNIRQQIYIGKMLRHAESSYHPHCASFSLLLAHVTPPPETGAATISTDPQTAYEDLDSANKARVSELVLCHYVWRSHKLGAPKYAILG